MERTDRADEASRGSRHVAAHGYARFDDERAAVAVLKTGTGVSEIGPALARFRAATDPD